MKRVMISAVVSRWIEVEDAADTHTILYETPEVFSGMDGETWDIDSVEIIDEETV